MDNMRRNVIHFQPGGHGNRAEDDRRRHAKNYVLIARRHVEDEAWEEARRLLERALACHPDNASALRTLAGVELAQGQFASARKLLEHSLALEPGDPDALFLQGNLAMSEGRYLAALEAYRQAEETGGQGNELLYNAGLAHLILGHAKDAAATFTRLLDNDPAHVHAWDGLGCAQRLAKDYETARASFEQALHLDPQVNDVRDHLAQMLLETGKLLDARTVLATALTIEPRRGSSRHLLGMVHAAQQQYPQAIACWETVIAYGGAQVETYNLLANAYLRLNDSKRALPVLEAMIKLFPYHLSGHLQLALLLLERGEHERGWFHLERARAIDPHHPAVRQLVSTAQQLSREWLNSADR